MSDESDWESDGDAGQEEQPVQLAAPQATTESSSSAPAGAASSAAAAASPSPSSSPPPTPSTPPSMLVALPITLSLPAHPALAAGISAGVTLLHDVGKGGLLSVLAYDAQKQPLILETLDAAKIKALKTAKLPFGFAIAGDGDAAASPSSAASVSSSSPLPGSVATLTDGQGRKWTLSFNSAADCARFAALLAQATLISKAAASLPVNQLFVRHDVSKGTGKSCKAKQFVALRVQAWVTHLSTDSNLRGSSALARIANTTNIAAFNPQLAPAAAASPAAGGAPVTPPLFDTTVADVEVTAEDESSSSSSATTAPTSLGEALTGGKLKSDGGARLLVLPSAAPLARQLLSAHGPPTFAPEASFVTLLLTPLSVSKKKEKKEKKKSKETAAADAPAADAAAQQDGDALAAAGESPVVPVIPVPADMEAAAGSVSVPAAIAIAPSLFPEWSREVSAASSSVQSALQSTSEQVQVLPSVQQKLVKAVMAELYEGLLDDLDLRATVEAQASDDEAVQGGVDPTQAARVAAVQTRVRGLVQSFVQHNSDAERRGTLAALVHSYKETLLPSLQALVGADPGALLSPQRLEALSAESSRAAAAAAASSSSSAEVASLRAALAKAQASAASASANKKLESELKSARAEAEKSRRALAELQGKHSALVMAHVELEETLAPLQSERESLKRDAQMAEVFQQGLTDLRGMLEKEIDEKNKIQQAWEDLQHTSKNLKLTWLPDKVVDRCMRCENKFGMFGASSRGHCRYCGRLFCGKCCGEAALPELGFAKPVKVCRTCLGFRAKVLNDAAAAQAEAQADAADDEHLHGGHAAAATPAAASPPPGASHRATASSGGASHAGLGQPNGPGVVLSYPDSDDD